MINGKDQTEQGERLQKVLASAGIASRRAAEALILAGRVKVNGEVVKQLGTRVFPNDAVIVDNKPISRNQKLTYVLLNKPLGVITSAKDPQGRPTVLDIVKIPNSRLYPVGRLDYDTSGLILLTNDGELAFRLTHPRYGVEKTYLVGIEKRPTESSLRQLAQGIELEDGKTSPAKVKYSGLKKITKHSTRQHALHFVEITIHEGRNRQVRRMFQALGHPVIYLQRIRFGPLELGDRLKAGEYRLLTPGEVHALKKHVGLS